MSSILTIVIAGGAGERLQPLTRNRTKPAVPFGGKFRLIDFTLSNCINSGIRQVFVLTQYRSGSLHKHIQDGWGISSSGLGEYIYCVPPQQKLGDDWYRGTADAVRQNLDLVKSNEAEHILILSGDHIYKMNYPTLVSYHELNKADLTIAAIRVTKEKAAGALGVIEVNKDSWMVGFEEKPLKPKTIADAPQYAFASMGVYVFSNRALTKGLKISGNDFGKDIIPQMLRSGFRILIYDYERSNVIEDFITEAKNGIRRKTLVTRTSDSTYWRDVGTIDSYYEANMDLIGVEPLFNLYGEKWRFRTYNRALPPSKFILGGTAEESIVCDGCIISGGKVQRSILSPGVVVERGTYIEDCIIFDDVVIEPDVRIRRAIIDKRVRIESGSSVGYDPEADKKRGCTLSDGGIVVVPANIEIEQV